MGGVAAQSPKSSATLVRTAMEASNTVTAREIKEDLKVNDCTVLFFLFIVSSALRVCFTAFPP